MPNENLYYPVSPPKLPGSYIIRDADGDIEYWGDSTNLYHTWCERVCTQTFSENDKFEYTLADAIEF